MKINNLESKEKFQHINDRGIVYVLIFALFISIVLMLNFSIRDYQIIAFILSGLCVAFFSVLIILSEKGYDAYRIRVIMVITIDFIIFPIAWIMSCGTEGPMLLYALNFLLISTIQIRNRIEYAWSVLLIVEIILLWRYESVLIPIVKTLLQHNPLSFPLMGHFTFASLITLIITSMNRRNFEEIKERLNSFYLYDDLTGLYSRRYANNVITDLLNEKKGSRDPFTLLLIDIDNFKKINDIYGHHVGDEVLKNLGDIIKETVESHGIGARYGGDEFLLITKEGSDEFVCMLIESITNRFNQYASRFNEVRLDLSIGISSDEHSTAHEIIKKADQQMYQNKAKNKCRDAK